MAPALHHAPCLVLLGLVFAACQGGTGAPVFGHPEQAPTRTIAGERFRVVRRQTQGLSTQPARRASHPWHSRVPACGEMR